MDGRKLLRRIQRVFLIILAVLMGILIVGLVVIKILFGRGADYPDVSTAPLVAAGDVTAVTEMEFPPGNVAGSRDGRVFFNIHPLAQAFRFTDTFLFELVDGKPRAYPDLTSQAVSVNIVAA